VSFCVNVSVWDPVVCGSPSLTIPPPCSYGAGSLPAEQRRRGKKSRISSGDFSGVLFLLQLRLWPSEFDDLICFPLLQNPIASFSIPMKVENWFPPSKVEKKREEIRDLILRLQAEGSR